MAKPVSGWLENQTASIFGKIPKAFLYAPVAVLVGALIAGTGRGELLFRSIGFFLVALWLSVDLWAWLLRKKVQAKNLRWWQSCKFAIGWACTSILLIIVAKTVLWGLSNQFEDQRKNTWLNLRLEHEPGIGTSDPMFEQFTVINAGDFDISKKHQLVCWVNLAVPNEHGGLAVSNLATSEDSKGDVHMAAPAPVLFVPSDSVVHSGGDVQTHKCLQYFEFLHTGCVDVSVIFWYALENQQDVEQTKTFRLVAVNDGNDHFTWSKQNKDDPHMFCDEYIHKREREEGIKPPS